MNKTLTEIEKYSVLAGSDARLIPVLNALAIHMLILQEALCSLLEAEFEAPKKAVKTASESKKS